MNKKRLWVLSIMICLLLAGCDGPKTETATTIPASTTNTGGGGEPSNGGNLFYLTEQQNGSSVTLAVGETIKIEVEGNPTTGFTWETENLDTALIEQAGEPTYIQDSDLTGSGGRYVFTFKALKMGATKVRLIYHRPFEKGVPPKRTFEVSVNIRE